MSASTPRRRIVKTYQYFDADGVLLYEVVRYEPKGFAVRRPTEDGGWEWGLGDGRPVLYRLPELIEALAAGKPVVINEGEKAVDDAVAAGWVSTTNPFGAGKWLPEFSEVFRSTKSPIVIVADNDDRGRIHAGQVYYSLRDVMVEGKLGIFVAKEGNDLSDHLGKGFKLRDLERVVLLPRYAYEDVSSNAKGPKAEVNDKDLPAALRRVLRKLGAVPKGNNQWQARCPAHDDQNPSLCIGLGRDVPVLAYCHAGCEVSEIADALGLDLSDFSVLQKARVSLGARSMSSIAAQKVTWLWSGRIPYGKITIIEGDPGLGKSTIALYIAAQLSRGRRFPFGAASAPATTLLVLAEDDPADTVRPRLEAAEADLARIHTVVPERDEQDIVLATSLPRDTVKLRAQIEMLKARLVVIDPVTAFVGEDINTHNDASVRRALLPLAQIAQETGAAIVLVRHLNKATGQNAMYRGGGSIGFTAAARSVLVVARHPDDPNTLCLASVKSNPDVTAPTITYTIDIDAVREVPFIRWGSVTTVDADTLLRGPDSRKDAPERDAAAADLAELLAAGPLEVKKIKRQMSDAGHSWSTVKRAKREIGVRSRPVRSEDGKSISAWEWLLPVSDDGWEPAGFPKGAVSMMRCASSPIEPNAPTSVAAHRLASPENQGEPQDPLLREGWSCSAMARCWWCTFSPRSTPNPPRQHGLSRLAAVNSGQRNRQSLPGENRDSPAITDPARTAGNGLGNRCQICGRSHGGISIQAAALAFRACEVAVCPGSRWRIHPVSTPSQRLMEVNPGRSAARRTAARGRVRACSDPSATLSNQADCWYPCCRAARGWAAAIRE